MSIILGIIIVYLIIGIITSRQDNNFIQSQIKDIKTVEELKYQKYLQENFRFVKPKYAGWYMGEIIKKDDPRRHYLKSDPKFLVDNGKWVLKKGKL